MLIDEVKIKVVAGSGGKGAVGFNKTLMSLGPSGGSGGKGGDVYLQGVSNLTALNKFRFKKEFKAEDGKNGGAQFTDGRNGTDLVLKVPVGTMIEKQGIEITKVDQKSLIARGGKGGKGNFLFRSSTNTSPQEFQYGKQGEFLDVHLELKMIADVGFVGLPNAGKSSLLNELTNAKSKVANYAFTTLEPNLGSYYGLILADIPGLIEGASSGKGLGIKFLKHIERTKVLFHLISSDSKDPVSDYQTVRNELNLYSKKLSEKTEYVLITKKDLISSSDLVRITKKIKKLNEKVVSVSMFEPESLKNIQKILNDLSND
jgi:GTPase